MDKIANSQKIKKIIMNPTAFVKCEIGGDYYKNDIEVIMLPNKWYPDYTQLQSWVMEELDGRTLNIEDVVDIIYDFLSDEFKPKELHVIDHVTGCRTHFDVTVEK